MNRLALKAFFAILHRDVVVTMREFVPFLLQALMQPLFILFIFGKVLPNIGLASGSFASLMLPGIVASLLLTFITSFDEFLLAYFLSGTEATLPVYIWGQLRFPERLPMVLALGAIILGASVGLVILAEYIRNMGARKPMVGA